MYDIKIIKKTLRLLKQYDYSFIKVSRELGIKVTTIRRWYNKEKNNEPLQLHTRNKKSKWSESFKLEILNYYFQHGENMIKTQRKFGEPSYSMLKRWVKEDKRYKQKHFVKKTPVKYNTDKKKQIVIEAASRTGSMDEIAAKYDVTRESIYLWEKEIAGGPIMKTKDKTKDELKSEIEKLKQEQQKLEMENKILKKANELIKKEMGANFNNLTNKEKTIIVSALKSDYKIKDLLVALSLKKSTYFYEIKHLNEDKYKDIRNYIKTIFNSNYNCYGYRRMKLAIKEEYGIIISEKVIIRLMREEKLIVYIPKSKKKYSSYEGEISPEVPNIVNRDFKANTPYEKTLTDISEFGMCDGKVYLSPLIDCYDGLPITWTIGKSPNSNLTNMMLDQAHKIIGDKNIIIHSDRGFHYRIPSWIDRMEKYKYVRSMSKKGCSPDNSMGEGFFGTIKNEFFYSRDWSKTKCDEFINELNKYLIWFKNKRIKQRLFQLRNV
ncbi:MAG: IS3 family transposase [Acholeplasmatales bacterium]|nr:IS3 family transposase [Acholeplasmatales bacterium]